MRKLSIFLIFAFVNISYASELKIEPVYGVERTLREFPKPARYRSETFLGIRATYGTPILSAEFEINQSVSQESFPAIDTDVTYTTQKALFGARTYPIKTEYFGLYVRGGLRAQISKRDITEDGEGRTEQDPLHFDPYAGSGLTLAFANNFALSAGADLVYNKNAADESEKFDTRFTFAVTVKAGNK